MRPVRPNNLATIAPYLWKGALGCFILAALTGFLYRLGMLGWIPGDFALGNIRHAHTHLMFFGWAAPLPLYILFANLHNRGKQTSGGLSWMKHSISAGMLFGILAYPFFFLYGYRPVDLGAISMPLSVIFSGLVMISWYGFIRGYLKERQTLDGHQAQPWFDGALALLLVSSLGAWGVSVAQAVDPSAHLMLKGMTHFFLAAFTEGWVVLAILAVFILELNPEENDWVISPSVALSCIALGAPLTFPYGISESLLSPLLLGVARFGGVLIAIGIFTVLYVLWRSGGFEHRILSWPLGLLAVKELLQFGASFTPSSFWLSDPALRILYLHILFLGALTLTGVGWLHVKSKVKDSLFMYFASAVIFLLISLILPSGLWPGAWSGIWVFYVLAATALLPVIAILWYAIHFSRSTKSLP